MRSVSRPPPRSNLSDTAQASHIGGRDRGPVFRLGMLVIAERDGEVEMSIAGAAWPPSAGQSFHARCGWDSDSLIKALRPQFDSYRLQHFLFPSSHGAPFLKSQILPFYGAAGTSPTARGRILLLSYHFPPAQTAGALRWQKLSRYADERGYGLDVVTLDPSALSLQDPSALADLPASVRVFGVSPRTSPLDRAEALASRLLRGMRTLVRGAGKPDASAPRSPSPASGAAAPTSYAASDLRFDPTSTMSWKRAYHAITMTLQDKHWALRAAALGGAIFEGGEHRVVVSCGPPHMVHEGARRLARTHGVPLVLDFRDAWSIAERLPEHFASPVWPRYVGRYEARALAQAGLVVMNTELAQRAMQATYPGASGRIIAALNGCDEGTVARSYTAADPFRIAYAGSIYLDRSPATLFRALARVVRELQLAPGDIEIAFMGSVADVAGRPLEAEAADAGVERYVRRHPLGTRREADRFLASAHALINLYQDTHMAIPSKIFEYMRHDAALIVLAEPGSATYDLMRGTPAEVAAPGDLDAIAGAIRRLYEARRAGATPRAMASDPRFSRRHQAERLLDALDALVESEGVRLPRTV